MQKLKLIRGGIVVTMEPSSGVDPAIADVLVEGDRIAEVGSNLSASGVEEIDARGRIVFPGLIDGHRHVWQSILRGIAANWTLGEYMIEARSMLCGCFRPGDAYIANYLGGLESLEAGITTLVDHSHLQKNPETSDALARGLLDSGVGGVFCYGLQNVPDFQPGERPRPDDVRDLLMRAPDDWHDANAIALRDRYFSGDGPLRFGVALPETTPYAPPEIAAALASRARRLGGSLLTGHWDGNPHAAPGPTGVAAMRDAGVFDQPTLLTHCNSLGGDDITIMVRHGVGLCCCPDIEVGMGIGSLKPRSFTCAGGHACLGLDLSSYVEADMLKQARLLLQVERHDAAKAEGGMPKQVAWTAREAFQLLTIGGARALGLDGEIGSLEPGKRADIAVAGPNGIMAMPAGDPIATLMFYTNPGDIETVLVGGEVRKRDGRLVGVDRAALAESAGASAAAIGERMAALSHADFEQVWAGMF